MNPDGCVFYQWIYSDEKKLINTHAHTPEGGFIFYIIVRSRHASSLYSYIKIVFTAVVIVARYLNQRVDARCNYVNSRITAFGDMVTVQYFPFKKRVFIATSRTIYCFYDDTRW